MKVTCPDCGHEWEYKKQLHDGFFECHTCNKTTPRKRADQKFCSDKCRYDHHNLLKGKAMKRAKQITEVNHGE